MRNLFFILLLAAICIVGCELAVCRVMEPALYEQITTPIISASRAAFAKIRVGASSLYNHATETVTTFSQFVSSLRPPEEPQIAEDPPVNDNIEQADPAVTAFEMQNGQERLTGGNVTLTYYNQKDEAWAASPYGSDQIGPYGCGPTAMAMVISSLTQNPITPADMASWAANAGYWAFRSGSYLSIVEGTANAYGLRCTPVRPADADELRQKLASDGIIVALMGAGHFTRSGHFILLHGVALDGNILVADPNSRDNSLAEWDAQLILDEISDSSENGAPLWLITEKTTL